MRNNATFYACTVDMMNSQIVYNRISIDSIHVLSIHDDVCEYDIPTQWQ